MRHVTLIVFLLWWSMPTPCRSDERETPPLLTTRPVTITHHDSEKWAKGELSGWRILLEDGCSVTTLKLCIDQGALYTQKDLKVMTVNSEGDITPVKMPDVDLSLFILYEVQGEIIETHDRVICRLATLYLWSSRMEYPWSADDTLLPEAHLTLLSRIQLFPTKKENSLNLPGVMVLSLLPAIFNNLFSQYGDALSMALQSALLEESTLMETLPKLSKIPMIAHAIKACLTSEGKIKVEFRKFLENFLRYEPFVQNNTYVRALNLSTELRRPKILFMTLLLVEFFKDGGMDSMLAPIIRQFVAQCYEKHPDDIIWVENPYLRSLC